MLAASFFAVGPLGFAFHHPAAQLATKPSATLRSPSILLVPALATPPELSSQFDVSLASAPLLGGSVGHAIAPFVPSASPLLWIAATCVAIFLASDLLTIVGRALLRAASSLERVRAAVLSSLSPAVSYATAAQPQVAPPTGVSRSRDVVLAQQNPDGLASHFRRLRQATLDEEMKERWNLAMEAQGAEDETTA